MEPKIAKALDRVSLDLKRKRDTQSAVNPDGGSQPLLCQCPSFTSPTGKVSKQMRLVGSKSKLSNSGTDTGQSLIRCYFNYKKSGRPERLLFYKNGEWLDFPNDVVEQVKKDLAVKKAAVEVETNGYHLVLDFLHMYNLDLKTGLQQPIAWIDEKGCCFFPEVYAASDEEAYDFCKEEAGKSYDPWEIKLHLDIDLNRVDGSKIRECSGESNVLVDDVKVEDNIIKRDRGDFGEAIEQTESVYWKLDTDTVQKMFLKGMSSFGSTGIDVVDVYHCSGLSMQARLELFQKQAEITKKIHGDANVRYAWLASSKGTLSTIMEYGLGHCRLSSPKCTYGVGVHLAAVTCPYASACDSDNDENGIRHLVFCRVIMGNMEPLSPGTHQFYPSSSEYDNGVDDIQNPTYYVVWNMNMNTHIYPEFVVSFKVSSDAEGYLCGSESKNNGSGVNMADQGSSVDTTPQGKAASIPKGPTSPWLPFPLLLAAIRKNVPSKDMELVQTYYEQLVAKQISRDSFVQKLRMIAGDNLLRAAIHSLHPKVPSTAESRVSIKKEV